MGGSPGLVVMGRDSRYKGRGFESWHSILNGHFFTSICCNVCLKRLKINEKRPGLAHLKNHSMIVGSNNAPEGDNWMGRGVASDITGP